MSATVVSPPLLVSTSMYPLGGDPSKVTKLRGICAKADGSLCYMTDDLNDVTRSRILTFNPATGASAILFPDGGAIPLRPTGICLSAAETTLYVCTETNKVYSIALPGGAVALVADLNGAPITGQLYQMIRDPDDAGYLLVLSPFDARGTDIVRVKISDGSYEILPTQYWATSMDAVPGMLLSQRGKGGFHSNCPIVRYLRAFNRRTEVVAGYYGGAGEGAGPAFTTMTGSHSGIATDDGRTNVYFSTGGGLKVVNGGNIAIIDAAYNDRGLLLIRSTNRLLTIKDREIAVFGP